MDPRLKDLVVFLSIIVLIAYVDTFISYIWDYYFQKPADTKWLQILARVTSNGGVDYVWTSASVLVGSVVAVALGQPDPNRGWLPKGAGDLVVIYGWTWATIGVIATIVWIFHTEVEVPELIKGAVTTFWGLLIPVVASFLKYPHREVVSSA